MSESLRESRLPSGLRVVTLAVPEARSAAAGLYLLRGSRDETESQGGLTHLLEHLLFKGTRPGPGGEPGRSARELACAIDALGGGLDAWTRHESLGLEVEVLPESLPDALALLAELLSRPTLEPADLEREREVIREEIRSVEDDPVEAVDEAWSRRAFPGHPLGRPILGTEEQLDGRTAEELRGFHASRLAPGVLLACAAGRLEHEEVLAAWSPLAALPARDAPPAGPEAPAPRRGLWVRRKESLEQAQLILALPGLAAADPRQEALDLLLVLLGEGNSSRLWQRVREEEALAYDVGTSAVDHRDCGRVLVEAAAAPARLRPILRVVREELDALRREGPDEEELERARLNLRTGLVLSREGAGEHLDALVDDLVIEGRHVPLDERLKRLEAVTREQVHALARELFGDERRSLVVLGPPETPKLGDEELGPD